MVLASFPAHSEARRVQRDDNAERSSGLQFDGLAGVHPAVVDVDVVGTRIEPGGNIWTFGFGQRLCAAGFEDPPRQCLRHSGSAVSEGCCGAETCACGHGGRARGCGGGRGGISGCLHRELSCLVDGGRKTGCILDVEKHAAG